MSKNEDDPFSRSIIIGHSPPSNASNCQLCYEPDTINMVSCAECKLIVHCKCVGITTWNTDNVKWSCRKCMKKKNKAQGTELPNQSPHIINKNITTATVTISTETTTMSSTLSTVVPSTILTTLPTVTSPIENAAMSSTFYTAVPTTTAFSTNPANNLSTAAPPSINQTTSKAQSEPCVKSMNPANNFSTVASLPINLTGRKTPSVHSVRSTSSKSSKQKERERALAKHAEWAELQKTIFEEKWKVLDQIGDSSDEEIVNEDNQRIEAWVDEQNQSKVTFNLNPILENGKKAGENTLTQKTDVRNRVLINNNEVNASHGQLGEQVASNTLGGWNKPMETSRSSNRNSQIQSEERPKRITTTQREDSTLPWLNAKNQAEFLNSTSFHRARTDDENENVEVSLKQIALRQVVTKELPTFTGDPTEWPMFISAYVRSTKACGFSNEENLIRLQKSLKGKALGAVKSKLLLPDTVPLVLNTLRMLFGRPELVLQRMIDQVRNEPTIHPEKIEMLVEFSMSVQHLCALMEVSGMYDHLNNPILLQELLEKLPGSLKLQWASFKMQFHRVNLSTFNNWLYGLAEAAGSVMSTKSLPLSRQENKTPRRFDKIGGAVHAAHVQSHNNIEVSITKKNCVICEHNSHHVADCQKFKHLNVDDRWKIMREKRLCRKCLGSHHVSKCRSSKECGQNGCPYKHHPLLHDPVTHKPNATSKPISEPRPSTSSNIVGAHHTTTEIFSRIIPVVLHGKSLSVKTFAFLDDGSHLSLVDEELARSLQVQGPADDLCLQWTSSMTRVEKNSMKVSMEISGVDDKEKYRMDGVYTVKALDLPSQTVTFDVSKYQHLRDIPFVRYTNAKPRIIIGLAHAGLSSTLQLREGNWGEPVAARTRLGWTIYGTNTATCHSRDSHNTFVHGYHSVSSSSPNENLHQLVKEYFSLESFGVHCPNGVPESVDNKRSRQVMEKTTVLKGERYEAGLVWRYENVELPDSYPMAMRRLINLENKMKKDPVLALAINNEFDKYLRLGYARQLSIEEVNETDGRTWYLPVFAVKNPNKPEKTRIVWDAAAEVRGVSLNSVLLKGPDFLIALPDILLRFREHPIALAGDIEAMFHQITIRKEDQNSQRFLWRFGNQQQRPEVFVMTVMTFGASCSPSCAHFVKNINAKRFADDYPKATKEILQNHYVDDWITSFRTEQEAIKTAKDVIKIHSSGGFNIRNWCSNSERVLTELGKRSDQNDGSMGICDESESRILGLRWLPTADAFLFRLNVDRVCEDIITGKRTPTKREVLRTLMLVFDPLGLIAFFMVYLKILLQRIWKVGTDWDQQIFEDHQEHWIKWTKMLPQLATLQIPRCIFPSQPENIQLHVFVDASEYAYSALAYFRIEDAAGTRCELICAKTKVAPLKIISIPRLELLAAVLGSRLATWVCRTHSVQPTSRHFWSDSQNVLCWIRSEHKRYRQFVAFRIAEILEATKVIEWRWIPTRENVADDATKWKSQPEINARSRWFQGPNFLAEPAKYWPEDKNNPPTDDSEEFQTHFTHVNTINSSFAFDVKKFSNYRKLLRCVAWALRFFYKCKQKKQTGPLKPCEIERAEMELFRQAQIDCFSTEISILSKNQSENLPSTSSLYKLMPFLDEHKILRQKGRISRAECASTDAKNPIIMPADHQITRLLINHYHAHFHHHNHETVVNELRQRFHISKLRATLKKVRYACQICKNQSAIPLPPEMAEHPIARLAAYSTPFTYVGIDLFGPYEVIVGRHVEKRWPMLFTCLTVRAIHIEIVHTLDKHSCIMAIRNFMARRGTPKEIRTDNGTNFHGTNNEWKKLCAEFSNTLEEQFDTIQWIFNPPLAPHMGGCWERLIRNVKKCLDAAMPMRRPNDETFRCFLMEAENMVNSRPLTYMPLENCEEEALTPNHFLIGSSCGVKPLGLFTDDVFILRRNYQISQRMADHFWRRWVREYMPDLTRTTKWFKRVKPIVEGDIAVIVDENKRNLWRKAVIVKVLPGKDKKVRRVVLRTADGLLERPTAKVAVLDVKIAEINHGDLPQQGGECYDRLQNRYKSRYKPEEQIE